MHYKITAINTPWDLHWLLLQGQQELLTINCGNLKMLSFQQSRETIVFIFMDLGEWFFILQEGRISDDFPFCVNDTMVEQTILEQGCRGDFPNLELSAEVGVLGNTTLCREGSLPDIVHKIARQIVTIVGACEEESS